MGPPPSIRFHQHFRPTRGTHFTQGHPFLYFVHLSQIYSLYKHLYSQPFPLRYSGHHHWRPSSLFGNTQPMSPLVGASLLIHPHRHRLCLQSTTQVTYHLSSEFVHLVPPLAPLILGLGVPLTLDLVTWLRPLFVSYILQPRAFLSLPTS
jgi:hypothetical protein